MKRIAAITMVRNDDFYLRRWTAYYGGQIGEENLYIFLDGKDQPIPTWCPKAHIVAHDRIPGTVVEAEKHRLGIMSDTAAKLFSQGYDLVIGVDADEYLVVDPKLGKSLAEYLSGLKIKGSVSGLGLDFGQKLGEEGDITENEPFLCQRKYAQIGTRYTKPSVLAEPLRWGRGFHRVKGHNFHIAKDLYLLHFGYFDMARIRLRFADPDRLAAGWEKHMHKRSRTIRYVSSLPARNFEKLTPLARCLQTILRPPYAWNKPSMVGLKIVVRIPDRFRNLV